MNATTDTDGVFFEKWLEEQQMDEGYRASVVAAGNLKSAYDFGREIGVLLSASDKIAGKNVTVHYSLLFAFCHVARLEKRIAELELELENIRLWGPTP